MDQCKPFVAYFIERMAHLFKRYIGSEEIQFLWMRQYN